MPRATYPGGNERELIRIGMPPRVRGGGGVRVKAQSLLLLATLSLIAVAVVQLFR